MTTGPAPNGDENQLLHVSYEGASRFSVFTSSPDGRLMPAAVPCKFDDLGGEMDALLDTGSQYCFMRPDVAKELGLDTACGDREHVWHGDRRYAGVLVRYPVRIPAVAGQDLLAEPPWFVTEDWDGPMVLGMTGFLAALRAFGCKPGVDPDEEGSFCFLQA